MNGINVNRSLAKKTEPAGLAATGAFPKLIVLDLDGTILGGGHVPYARIPQPLAAFLDDLVERGCRWALCSTWEVAEQWKLVLDSPVRSRPIFLVGEMGRVLSHVEADGPVAVEPYTSVTNDLTIRLARQHMLPFIAEMCRRYSPVRINYYEHLLGISIAELETAPPDGFNAFLAGLPGLCAYCQGNWIKVHLREVNKGRAVKEIMNLCGLSPEQVVAAGDEPADISMTQDGAALHAICPANADDRLKQHVLGRGGVLAEKAYGNGIVEGFITLAQRHGWTALQLKQCRPA